MAVHTVWRRNVSGGVEHVDPDAGRVYATVDDGDATVALDAATGAEVWRLSTPGSGGSVGTDPHDGTAYLAVVTPGSGSDRLLALTVDGTEQWAVDIPGGQPTLDIRPGRDPRVVTGPSGPSARSLATRDALYLHGREGGPIDATETLVAMDRATGAERWREDDPWSPVAATDQRVVTARLTDGPAVRALDARTGHEAWRHDDLWAHGASARGLVAHHDGHVYVAGDDGLYVLDRTTGGRSQLEARHPSVRRLLVTDGHLCVVRESEVIDGSPSARCYDLTDPTAPARVGGDGPGIVPDAATDGLLFEGGGPGNHEFAAADPERGELWRHEYQRGITRFGPVTDRTVYVTTIAEGTLRHGEDAPPLSTFAVDRASGDIRWSFVHAGTSWLGSGVAYLQDRDTVHALDAASGDVLGSVAESTTGTGHIDRRRVGTGLLWHAGDELRLDDPSRGGDGTGTRVFGDDGPAYCPACGTGLTDRDAVFCPSCGTRLNDR